MLGLVGDVDVRTMKGVVEEVLGYFGLGGDVKTTEAEMDFLADAVALTLDGEMLGYLGRVTPEVLSRYGLKTGVSAAEMDFGRVMREGKVGRGYTEIPRFPEITRDLAVVVDEDVRWADIEKVVAGQGLELLEETTFMSEFRGEQVGEGRKSIAFSLVFRASDRTLTNAEADEARDVLLAALTKAVGAELRQ